jgi:hypothetical protein
MYVKLGIEARSHNHCCRGKAIRTTYSGCVSVVLVIQHSNRMSCIVVCGLSRSTISLHYLKNGMILGKAY